MARGHTPFGYRIRDGRAEICETEVHRCDFLLPLQ